MRLNQYLANCGFGSRRSVEELILRKLIRINGRVGQLTDQVEPDSDVVKVRGKEVKLEPKKIYLFFKPAGVVVSSAKQNEEKTVLDYLPKGLPRLFPVGRLDKKSTGLVILTNDGQLAQKLSHPRYFHEKEYDVEVHGSAIFSHLTLLSRLSHLGGQQLAPFKITHIKIQGSQAKFNLILTQGLNHQIRRMVDHVGLTVGSIKRVRIDKFSLQDLKPGQVKESLLATVS